MGPTTTNTCWSCGSPVGPGVTRCPSCADRERLADRPVDPVARYEPAQPPVRSAGGSPNTWAIVSLVLGVTAYGPFPVLGAIGAVYAGHRARREIARSGETGAGMATAGLVLGWLQLGLIALAAAVGVVALIVVLLIALAGAT